MRYHDYTEGHNCWGHAVVSFGEAQEDGSRRACIIGPRIVTGDVVLMSANRRLDNGEHGVLQYRVVGEVDTPMDPGDMHFVTLVFMSRETNDAEGKDPR